MILLQSQTFQEICVPRTFTNMALVEALLTEHEQASALDGETNDDGDAHCIPSGPVLPTVSVEETMVVEVVTPKGDDIFGHRQSAFEQLKELWMETKRYGCFLVQIDKAPTQSWREGVVQR